MCRIARHHYLVESKEFPVISVNCRSNGPARSSREHERRTYNATDRSSISNCSNAPAGGYLDSCTSSTAGRSADAQII
jgi:hypothetical protein